MTYHPQPKDTVTFRPDSRNGYKDYYITYRDAKRPMLEGIIHGDATNGGYMPSPKTPAPHVFKEMYEVKQPVKASKTRKKRGAK